MTNEGNASHSKRIPLEQAYDIGRVLIDLKEQIRKLTQEVRLVRKSTQQNPYH